MIPKKIKIELIIETDRATKDCTEEDIERWYMKQLQSYFKNRLTKVKRKIKF